MNLKALCQNLISAKNSEAREKKFRLKAEKDLLEAVKAPVEGSKTTATEGYKITLTGKLTRKLDWEAYQACGLPENLQFVDMEPKLNMKRLRAIEIVDPDLVAALVTTKAGKTGIKITEVG